MPISKGDLKKRKTLSIRLHPLASDEGEERRVIIVKPDLLEFVSSGFIPDPLVPDVERIIEGNFATGKMGKEEWATSAATIYEVVSLALVEPQLSAAEVKEYMSYDDIVMIFKLATRSGWVDGYGELPGSAEVVDDYRRFRKVAGGAEAGEVVEGVRKAAK